MLRAELQLHSPSILLATTQQGISGLYSLSSLYQLAKFLYVIFLWTSKTLNKKNIKEIKLLYRVHVVKSTVFQQNLAPGNYHLHLKSYYMTTLSNICDRQANKICSKQKLFVNTVHLRYRESMKSQTKWLLKGTCLETTLKWFWLDLTMMHACALW